MAATFLFFLFFLCTSISSSVEEIVSAEDLLFKAIEEENVQEVETLLQKGAKVEKKNEDGNTPLHVAAYKGNVDIIEILLKFGANPHERNYRDGKKCPLHYAVIQGNIKAARVLLKSTNELYCRAENSASSLHLAARDGNISMITSLCKNGARIYYQDTYGHTPVYWAAQYGKEEALEFFLEEMKAHIKGREGFDLLCAPFFDMKYLEQRKKIVSLLLKYGAKVNSKQAYHEQDDPYNLLNPLFLAASYGDEEIVKLLLEAGAKVNQQYYKNYTPLHAACSHGSLAIVRLLLDSGANPYIKSDNRGIPLSEGIWPGISYPKSLEEYSRLTESMKLVREKMDCKGTVYKDFLFNKVWPYYNLINVNYKPLLKLFLDEPVQVDLEDSEGKTSLYYALSKEDKEIVEFLINRGACVQKKDSFGNTLLHQWASCFPEKSILKIFLMKGLSVHAKNKFGAAPLRAAARNLQKRGVLLLLAHGACVDEVDDTGQTPLHHVAMRSTEHEYTPIEDWDEIETESSWRPFQKDSAVLVNKVSEIYISKEKKDERRPYFKAKNLNIEVACVLLAHGAFIDAKDNRLETPLWNAILHNDKSSESFIRFLIKNGADVNVKNSRGKSLLHELKEYKSIFVRLLIKKGDVIDVKDKDGNTPLMYAIGCKKQKAINFLLEGGADCTAKNAQGETALHFAVGHRCIEAVKLLLEYGACVNETNGTGENPLYFVSLTNTRCESARKEQNNIIKYLISKGALLSPSQALC